MSNANLDALSRSPQESKPPKRLPAWLLPAGILAGFCLLFIILFRDRLLPATEVETGRAIAIEASGDPAASTPADAPLTPIFQASGWIEPDPYAVKATSLVDGVIDQVHVLEGERVEKGQLLATLIAEDYELELATAKSEHQRLTQARNAHCAGINRTIGELEARRAEITAAEAVRDAAKDRLERLQKSGSRAVSERDIVDARLELVRVNALVQAATANLSETTASLEQLEFETEAMLHSIETARIAVDQAALALERTRITAPISGRVLRLTAAPGQKRMLGMDDPDSSTIAILYNPEKLQIRVDVPLSDAAGLHIGQATRIRCSLLPDQSFNGTVTRILGEADIQRNTLQAKIEIENPDDALRPEMICRVEFLSSPSSSIHPTSASSLQVWIDRSALDSGQVWVVDPDTRRVDSRAVTLGSQTRDGHLLVTDGLFPGERVVLNPNNLRRGQRVRSSDI
ncbi:MAG: efflux RND transporter periplasmic adaptor subunit [Verrucomicrobiota bacterium JB025]|nr:efflux RND transporter periplasmic adaptor subunit [Verrucomicrobiota bacterium JB025]